MKKTLLLLFATFMLAGCSNTCDCSQCCTEPTKEIEEQIDYSNANYLVFAETVIDNERGYSLIDVLANPDGYELIVPPTYNGLNVIAFNLPSSYDSYFWKMKTIHLPATIKFMRFARTMSNNVEKLIFDGDIKEIVDLNNDASHFEKIYYNGSFEGFENTNLYKTFSSADVYFKEGNEYVCKIERSSPL